MNGSVMVRRGWPELMLELGDALERLGPIRAELSREYGLILDGRYGVSPAEVIAAAAALGPRRRARCRC